MDPKYQVLNAARQTMEQYLMVTPGDRVIVAVSGGPDSVALLHILIELREKLKISLVVAHLDHGLRPAEDEAETSFVHSLALALQLPCAVGKAPPRGEKFRGSLEEWAREVRYGFLQRVMEEAGAQKIALGHTLNDQAETVLLRLLRGSGTTGLSGMRPVRDGTFIRPLIEVTRGQVLSYLDTKGLAHMSDSSNLRTDYLRNRIRLHLVPILEGYQPQIIRLLGQSAHLLRLEDEWMEGEAIKWLGNFGEKAEGEMVLPLRPFREIPKAFQNRIIRAALQGIQGGLRRISLRHINAIHSVASSTRPLASVHLPKGLSVQRVYERLVFRSQREEGLPGFSVLMQGPGAVYVDALKSTLVLHELARDEVWDLKGSRETALLDAARITYPLLLRTLRPGDRMIPLGMTGHKKLNDLLMEQKIPRTLRARWPVLISGDKPVWLWGIRIDEHYKITGNTEKALMISLPTQGFLDTLSNSKNRPGPR